jgi:small conductance mechanosensitive channel
MEPMLLAKSVGRAVGIMLVISASAAYGQSGGEASVRLNGVPVIRVTASGDETATSRASRIERRLERLADRVDETARPAVMRGPTDDTRVVQLGDAPIVTVTRADAEDHLLTVDALAAQWASALGVALDQARASRLSPWRRFGMEVRGSVMTAVARLGESATRIIPRALAAFAVLGVFWAVAAGLRAFLRVLFRRVISDLTVENLLQQVVYCMVWAIGILVAADALGFEPETVVTGLGLTSLALGFALKDIISNFVSGILILGLRPFQLGDEIVVGETEGAVQRIRLRATEIKTYDGRLVLVPNAELFTSRVTNNTAAPVRRTSVEVPVAYGTDLAQAERALTSAAASVAEVLTAPAPTVRVRLLGTTDMVLELRFWTDSTRADLLATTSVVRRRVVEAFIEAGLPLPEPDLRRVELQTGPPA